jgi:hypothetical protein
MRESNGSGIEHAAGATLFRLRLAAFSRLALGAAALACAGAASAQLAPGRSGSSTTKYLSSEESMVALVVFGRCYAKQQPEKAMRLIATEPTSRAEAQTYIELFRKSDEACLGDVSSMSIDLPLVRGAIAEGLYRSNVALPPALMQTAPAPAEVRNLAGAARCYTAAHRQEVRALLAETKAGSRKEFDAVSRLMPDFYKCVPGGAKFNFSATVIRFRLAEALLRTSISAAAEAK